MNEIEEMLKKLKETADVDEFIEKAKTNNIKLNEIINKSNYAYEEMPGILTVTNLNLINAEIHGIKLQAKNDFESTKKIILNKFTEIENTLEA
ncbi:MAG: hypothetical protein N3A69_13665, partial [Leptospiraceae bacterium]|nr:hypothetical protein [Leptospiraceae bacterium]